MSKEKWGLSLSDDEFASWGSDYWGYPSFEEAKAAIPGFLEDQTHVDDDVAAVYVFRQEPALNGYRQKKVESFFDIDYFLGETFPCAMELPEHWEACADERLEELLKEALDKWVAESKCLDLWWTAEDGRWIYYDEGRFWTEEEWTEAHPHA